VRSCQLKNRARRACLQRVRVGASVLDRHKERNGLRHFYTNLNTGLKLRCSRAAFPDRQGTAIERTSLLDTVLRREAGLGAGRSAIKNIGASSVALVTVARNSTSVLLPMAYFHRPPMNPARFSTKLS
jgi:hypothetical protein